MFNWLFNPIIVPKRKTAAWASWPWTSVRDAFATGRRCSASAVADAFSIWAGYCQEAMKAEDEILALGPSYLF